MSIPRNEYPRPQFVRKHWFCLNGEWEFSFDIDVFDRKIIVPYAHQTKLSGVDVQEFHDVVWYKRNFELPHEMRGKNTILHFGAVDYHCRVWVNDTFILEHIGGHVGFCADITHALKDGINEIKLKALDDATDLEMPRGKQFWEKTSRSIFYTRTTGIWQTVWLESVEDTYLSNVWMTPDIDRMALDVQYEIIGTGSATLKMDVLFEGKHLTTYTVSDVRNEGKCSIGMDRQTVLAWQPFESMVWTPESPRLFDIIFTVSVDGKVTDKVESYFGMRKVSVENGKFLLNNRPYYQKLLLDQGYWEDSLLTAPTDEDYIVDIKLAKEMGFNGVRKHQKIEDPRFLYHADKMGFLVWGEIAAAYNYSNKYVKRITGEWIDGIFRDYNHPCIVVWTPLNESWGVTSIMTDKQQQAHSAAMVFLTKSLDKSRLVVSNDGWEHTVTDLLTIHDYEGKKEILKETYKDLQSTLAAQPATRPLYANGWNYSGEPILMTEFGGISYKTGSWDGWGYTSATSDEDFAQRLNAVISAILGSPIIQGYCYTQIADVEQEINGLLTYDRKPKIDLDIIRRINEGSWEG
ncbi:MAG: glycoside hydrolase family 2 [Oscillospiraceae bacterium]|nr:glycoside hydrolase family 2 [Oscillospiraceae bacterium]